MKRIFAMLMTASSAAAVGGGGGGDTSIPTPTLDPPPGLYEDHPGSLPITMNCAAPAVKMRYRTDGIAPTISTGTLIASTSGTFSLGQGLSADMRVIAYDASDVPSGLRVGHYDNIFDSGA